MNLIKLNPEIRVSVGRLEQILLRKPWSNISLSFHRIKPFCNCDFTRKEVVKCKYLHIHTYYCVVRWHNTQN